MNLIAKKVRHIKFGEGIVTDKRGDIIEIAFSGSNKKFHFPDAFYKFITCMDSEIQTGIETILNDTLEIERQKEERERMEQERIQRIQQLKVSANSQAAFGLIENSESEVLKTWSICTGKYISGNSKGKPRVPNRLRLNSACLLTELPDGMKEKERRIIGAFMVQDDFEGKKCEDGIINSHDVYRIFLNKTKEELLFWDYFESNTKNLKWGNTEMKYFSNACMQKVLDDMKKVVRDEERYKILEYFYEYFCKVNKLD